MTDRSQGQELLTIGLAAIAITTGLAVFVVARSLGVDFWTAGEFIGWMIIGLLILAGAAWNGSRSHWEQPMIRLGTVWPLVLSAVWQGVFNLLRYIGSGPEVDMLGREIPSYLADPVVAWYATTAFQWSVGLLILIGGYGINFYRASRY
ncbi:hypothetical protein [Stutzerimonas nitrititolerans]|jgi:hypothetical protein|uniref:hypothetical protein n=1 Tax=Stutzerimonas nitrititolerans TaxID=2482751 RepID=UPI000596BE30|nr:hypothetical protein [Stutzerimonas nitrititolerans]KIL03135.1 hypothetical protein QX25_18255 [Stutzerimonas stutzeri]